MIKKFLREIAFQWTDTDMCILGPEPENVVAIKAYGKVGFKHFKTVTHTDNNDEYLMKVGKDTIE